MYTHTHRPARRRAPGPQGASRQTRRSRAPRTHLRPGGKRAARWRAAACQSCPQTSLRVQRGGARVGGLRSRAVACACTRVRAVLLLCRRCPLPPPASGEAWRGCCVPHTCIHKLVWQGGRQESQQRCWQTRPQHHSGCTSGRAPRVFACRCTDAAHSSTPARLTQIKWLQRRGLLDSEAEDRPNYVTCCQAGTGVTKFDRRVSSAVCQDSIWQATDVTTVACPITKGTLQTNITVQGATSDNRPATPHTYHAPRCMRKASHRKKRAVQPAPT
jgi:hypothetical protein